MSGLTLTQFIIEEQRRFTGATGEFTLLLNDVVTACKKIANQVNKGALLGTMGSLDSENVQGEVQKQLDVITNDIFISSLEWSGHLAGMASEEMEAPYDIPPHYPTGKYLILFDPQVGVDVDLAHAVLDAFDDLFHRYAIGLGDGTAVGVDDLEPFLRHGG